MANPSPKRPNRLQLTPAPPPARHGFTHPVATPSPCPRAHAMGSPTVWWVYPARIHHGMGSPAPWWVPRPESGWGTRHKMGEPIAGVGQDSDGVGGGSVGAGFHGSAVEEFVFRGGFAALLRVHWPAAGFGGCPGHHNRGVRAGVGGGRGARCIVMAWGPGQVPGPRGAAVVPFFGGAIVGTQAASRMPVASRSAPIGAARVIARERLRPERPVPVWSLWTTFCAFGLLRGSCPDAAC
jgi:hypothetical protein